MFHHHHHHRSTNTATTVPISSSTGGGGGGGGGSHNTNNTSSTADDDEAEEDEFLANEEALIARVRDDLRHVGSVASSMKGILESLENKLGDLAHTIEPIHKQTQALTHSQRNLDQALQAVDVIMAHTQVANDTTSVPAPTTLSNDPHRYVEWLNHVNEALAFFQKKAEQHKNTSTVKRLKSMQSAGEKEVEQEFGRLLNLTNTRVRSEFDKHGALPARFDLLPPNTVERLALYASCLDRTGARGYYDILKEHRGTSLKKTLKYTLSSQAYAPLLPQAPTAAAAAAATATHTNLLDDDDDDDDDDDGEEEELKSTTNPTPSKRRVSTTSSNSSSTTVGGVHHHQATPPKQQQQQQQQQQQPSSLHQLTSDAYTKNSHRVIVVMRFFLQLLRLEYDLLLAITQDTNMAEESLDAMFTDVVTAPLEYMQRKVLAAVSKEKGANCVLILLDVLDALHELVPGYSDLLKRDHHVLNTVLVKEVVRLLERAIESYGDHILSYHGEQSTSAKQLSKDGTVYTLSIETVNFAKALSEYADVVERHHDAFGRVLAALPPDYPLDSTLGRLVTVLFMALEKNLAQKASGYKSEALAAVFLINNYNYVMKAVRRADWYHCLGDDFFVRYDREVRGLRDQYNRATWDKALKHISLADKEDVLRKCVPAMTSGGKKAVKAKFTGFNQHFTATYDAQRKFAVPDTDLRQQLREDNERTILPAYKEFLATYGQLPFSKTPGLYLQYDPVTLAGLLTKFFDEDA